MGGAWLLSPERPEIESHAVLKMAPASHRMRCLLLVILVVVEMTVTQPTVHLRVWKLDGGGELINK